MIPALLDSDEVSQEEQIRAMRELSQREDDASKLRVNMDTASEFELVTQLELPPRPEIYRESPVTQVRCLTLLLYMHFVCHSFSIYFISLDFGFRSSM